MLTMKKIKISVEAKAQVPLETLEPFQGTLKKLETAQFNKLKKVLIEEGISFAVHVWQNKGKNHIIDGHQRVFVLKQLKEVEGYEVPDVPIALVSANSYAEAKRKVLAGASQYGKLSKEGLIDFMNNNEISFDDLSLTFDFPEIDFDDLADDFKPKEEPDFKPGTKEDQGKLDEKHIILIECPSCGAKFERGNGRKADTED